MKKLLVGGIIALVLMMAAWYYGVVARQVGEVHQVTRLPWQIERAPDGEITVFDITLGQTTVAEVISLWGVEPDLGLFEERDGERRIEAYFEKIRLGVLNANIILHLSASAEQHAELSASGLNPKPQPSGARKYGITEQDRPSVEAMTFTELTYIPQAQFEPEIVRERFGEPTESHALDAERTLWLYPNKGLAVVLDTEKREILHYALPDRFATLRDRLGAATPTP
ncbi:MAG: hypothetical protein ACFCUJ_13970 [Thiotrichales bacterium]